MNNYGSPFVIGRFLKNSWLKDNNSRIYHKAFQPRPNLNSNRLEVSCFEIQNLNSLDVFKIPVKYNIKPNNKYPTAYGSIPESDFPSQEIDIDFNNDPPRHCDIIGWENHPSKQDKKLISTLLAEKASKNIELKDQ